MRHPKIVPALLSAWPRREKPPARSSLWMAATPPPSRGKLSPRTGFASTIGEKVPMKKSAKRPPETTPAIAQEFPERLSELEVELRQHSGRHASERPLKSIDKL